MLKPNSSLELKWKVPCCVSNQKMQCCSAYTQFGKRLKGFLFVQSSVAKLVQERRLNNETIIFFHHIN